jgi:hypothetical protein
VKPTQLRLFLTRVCRECREEKWLDAFPIQKGGLFGRHPLCKECRSAQERERYRRDRDAILARQRGDPSRLRGVRRRTLRRKYGITEHDYWTLYTYQRGCCAICELVTRRLVIDHDHTTGQVRGLLCPNCNFAIGDLRDDPRRCVAAAEYLEARR